MKAEKTGSGVYVTPEIKEMELVSCGPLCESKATQLDKYDFVNELEW